MRLLLALAVLAAGGLVLIARDQADAPLVDREPAAPRAKDERKRSKPKPKPKPLRRARCPAGVVGCRSVIGRIVYVERVDPDGDGDLHVVVAAGSISLPGLTAIDVSKTLRPRHDPSVGDRATGAGPVQTGSYGQQQIHALRFRVQRDRAG
jgi:hypothetical protein